MIPSAEELHQLSLKPAGDLREVPFAVLLTALARNERTAVLAIERRQLKKEIVFEYGVPVDCRSNLVHETLVRFLLTQGKLTQEDHDTCLRESVTRGVQVGEVLRERGLVDSTELFRVLQANLAKKLLDGFTWSDGSYRLILDAPPVESPLKVKVPQLILTGVTRFSPQTDVGAAMWPLAGRPLIRNPQPPFSLTGLKLTPEQERLLTLLSQPRTLKEAAELSGLPFETAVRPLYAFALLGAVVPADQVPAATATPPAAAVPARAVDMDDTLDPAQAPELRNRVMEAYLAHRRQDPFDLLGLPEEASIAQIREAYLSFAFRHAPWRYRSPELVSVMDQAGDLFLAGARAFGELMNTEQRNTLLYRRKVLAEEKKRAKPTGFSIQTDLLDPEKQFHRGLALLEAGRPKEAVEFLEFAADCDPQNARYRAEAAFCRYRLDPQLFGRSALEALENAIHIDAHCGVAALYMGQVLTDLGELTRAEVHLHQANQLMAPDRRPIEALKELARRQKKGRR
jgi:hypothetical protein